MQKYRDEKMPLKLRLIVYSYFDTEILLGEAARASKRDRNAIYKCEADIFTGHDPFRLRLPKPQFFRISEESLHFMIEIRKIVQIKMRRSDCEITQYGVKVREVGNFEDKEVVTQFQLIMQQIKKSRRQIDLHLPQDLFELFQQFCRAQKG